jgi:hypothetical protein
VSGHRLVGLDISLPQSFVATAESADNSTHRGAGGSTFTRVARYRATDSAECCTSGGALDYVRFRRLVWLRRLDVGTPGRSD